MNKPLIVSESGTAAKTAGVADAGRAQAPLVGAAFETGAAAAWQLPKDGAPEIAFAGRSNSGKSSAINVLARQTRLAFASRTPGRTQLINFFRLRGGALVADLPGYGYAAVPRALKKDWQEFLWIYVTTRTSLVGLVLVVDARHGLRTMDEQLLGGFLPSGRPVLVLATKIDKLNQAERKAAVVAIRNRLGEAFPACTSAVRVAPFSVPLRLGVEDADATIASWMA
ncbi:MAG: YihA family ribosome biogenesis GTP-binding protein [Betaproteobacteria bacterium]|nr:YihA family ribosome biogenesis GTP-binding protein [Betaproteobacteria bacterium]